MEAVMSALSAIETPAAAADARLGARSNVSSRQRSLRVVDRPTKAAATFAGHGSVGADQARSSSTRQDADPRIPILTGTVVPGPGRRYCSAADGRMPRTPVRLTRRGRLVVGTCLVAVVSVVVLLVMALASGRAQATNHGQPGAGYQGMHQVVVRPGQTLWSIAAAAEPSADPRNVIQEIMSTNSLGSPTISAGQLLWVP